MASKPNPYAFPLEVSNYVSAPVPSMGEWEIMWKAWDLVTTQMIPADALMEQPIPLRNPLQVLRGPHTNIASFPPLMATGKPLTEPAAYAKYFERGIDPDMDNPAQCHDHSELPAVWPELSEMLEYREKVKRRIKLQYDTGRAYSDRTIGRALWIGYEHEGLHLETFLYMAILSPNIRPPPGMPCPDFAGMARDAFSRRVENQWFRIPEQELTIGYEDPESDEGPDRYFAWDNEREPYDVKTSAFEAQARPVSVGEFAAFLVDTGKTDAIPAMWVKLRNTQDGETTTSRLSSTESDVNGHAEDHTKNQNGDPGGDTALQVFIAQHGIRTVWGPIPYPKRVGGARLPTLHEVRSIHEHAARLKESQQPPTTTATESQSPFSDPPINSQNKTMHTDPGSIFVDLSGANAGLQNFHPVPITHRADHLCGLGDLGGAWEWTSTVFAPQPGFKPMDIYPGYSGPAFVRVGVVGTDFMDGKHMAITGGSWALPPRIAGRKSL
ncbi:hypothetical protein PG997_010093 [Apiospora hydei]|uniref:Sulfatase-modifying factor enzyme-like domain-containing protein n=1 Tax=Apiospora hydei TaxID=1337664 RepID=A0ABR1VVZ7_9PEZI